MTTEAKHTPGPWIAGKVFNDSIGGYPKRNVYAFDERQVCRVIADESRAENAALIAAAPALLEERDRLRAVNAELLAALRYIAAGRDSHACDAARAALALAEQGGKDGAS